MMKRRLICLLLAAALTLCVLAACGDNAPKDDKEKTDSTEAATESVVPSEDRTVENPGIPLYVRVDKSAEEISATFSSSESSKTETVKMSKVEDEGDTALYCCYNRPEEFNFVTVTTDGRDSDLLAFNLYTSGWELSPGREIPFAYGHENETPKFERKQFPYEDRTKDVLIWTPKNYDPDAEEKYPVIYMTDGHNLFDPNATSTGSWAVAESIETAMAMRGKEAIVVGIENMDNWRDSELTPNLGTPTDPNYEDGHGAYFCDFVVNTVMPYVEENYNVATDREHTAMCGSSSGGIESFYIAMEHPEKFGVVGALSPAFALFDDATWQKYLSEKDFSAGYPLIYLYCGQGDDLERVLYYGYESMPANLSTIDYPAGNIVSVVCPDAMHKELYWRAVFPDFLKFMFDSL